VFKKCLKHIKKASFDYLGHLQLGTIKRGSTQQFNCFLEQCLAEKAIQKHSYTMFGDIYIYICPFLGDEIVGLLQIFRVVLLYFG